MKLLRSLLFSALLGALLFLFTMLCAIPAHATVSCFASVGFGANVGSSAAINTTGASTLIAISFGFVVPALVADSQSNLWQNTGSIGVPGPHTQAMISWVNNPTTSSSHTFSIRQASGLAPSMEVFACSGTTIIYPLAVQTGVANAGASTFQPGGVGGVLPVEAGDLIVTGAGSSSGPTFTATIDSGFSTPLLVNSACCVKSGSAFLVAPSGSAVNPTWTMSANTDWAAVIAVFKTSASPAPPLSGPLIKTFAGKAVPVTGAYSGDGGPATLAGLQNPGEIAFDAAGDVCFADIQNNVIRCVNTQATTQTIYNVSVCAGCIQTVAGNGTLGCTGDGGAATSAEMGHPVGLAIDASGNMYIADQQCQRIREVTPAGGMSTFAGSGPFNSGCFTAGTFTGDGGPATSATLFCPQGVAVDAAGNVYVSDSSNNRIRAVNTQGTPQTLLGVSGIAPGNIQTVAGGQCANYTGDGGPAILACMANPRGTGFDGSGNLYISDYNNSAIRRVSSAGIISTFAGTGVKGYSGDGGAASSAQLNHPYDVKWDSRSVNAYIADGQNSVIRVVSAGTITTLAGDEPIFGIGTGFGAGYVGDGGPASMGALAIPVGVSVSASGVVYVGEFYNNRVREILPFGCYETCVTGGVNFKGDPVIR